MARAIHSSAKGDKQVSRLHEVLDEIIKRGGSRKAVIFTESVCTQKYLAGLLSANGYADDLDTDANIQIKEKEVVIKLAKKALRSNTELSLDDKIKEQRRIKTMDHEVDDLKMKTYERKKDIRAEGDAKLDALANALKTVPALTPVLPIQWEVSP